MTNETDKQLVDHKLSVLEAELTSIATDAGYIAFVPVAALKQGAQRLLNALDRAEATFNPVVSQVADPVGKVDLDNG